MRFATLLLTLLAASLLLVPARAGTMADEEASRVAMSDLIVEAEIASYRVLEGVPAFAAGELTLAVNKTYKGEAPSPLLVRCAVPPRTLGRQIAPHAGPGLENGVKSLFLLVRYLDSYALVGGVKGLVSPAEGEHYAALIAHAPASVTLAPLPADVQIGDKVTVEVTITNNCKVPLVIADPSLLGYVLGKDQKMAVKVDADVPAEVVPEKGYGTVPPGGSKTIKAPVVLHAAQVRELPPAEASLQVRLTLMLAPAEASVGAGWTLQSAIQTIKLKPGINDAGANRP